MQAGLAAMGLGHIPASVRRSSAVLQRSSSSSGSLVARGDSSSSGGISGDSIIGNLTRNENRDFSIDGGGSSSSGSSGNSSSSSSVSRSSSSSNVVSSSYSSTSLNCSALQTNVVVNEIKEDGRSYSIDATLSRVASASVLESVPTATEEESRGLVDKKEDDNIKVGADSPYTGPEGATGGDGSAAVVSTSHDDDAAASASESRKKPQQQQAKVRQMLLCIQLSSFG